MCADSLNGQPEDQSQLAEEEPASTALAGSPLGPASGPASPQLSPGQRSGQPDPGQSPLQRASPMQASPTQASPVQASPMDGSGDSTSPGPPSPVSPIHGLAEEGFRFGMSPEPYFDPFDEPLDDIEEVSRRKSPLPAPVAFARAPASTPLHCGRPRYSSTFVRVQTKCLSTRVGVLTAEAGGATARNLARSVV